MEYAEIAPRPALAAHVRCFWTLVDPAPAGHTDRVLPDGCCEIVLNLADPFAEGERSQPRFMLVGQIDRALRIRPTGVVRLLGIRFQPGGLFGFLGGAAVGELTGARIELEAIDRTLRADLEAAAEHGVTAVEEVLLRRLHARDGLVSRAAARLRATAGRVRIARLAADLGVSDRMLERAFRREVGLAPKVLARIERFQAVVRGVEKSGRLDWASHALQCGYFDQAHLIREFRRFAGVAPTAYFAEEHPMSDLFLSVSDSSNPASAAAG